jgi:beta-glucanase (GH16 family)
MPRWIRLLIFAVVAFLFLSPFDEGQNLQLVPKTASQRLSLWQRVWFDDFDYQGLPDPAKWGYDVGGEGWGNQELQYYTDRRKENARVEKGNLIIEARREPWQTREYTSARLVSKGKGDWTYGRVEVRAKLPSGRGTWPAIWMLPTLKSYGNGGWPDNGEIDVMEHVGFDPDVVHGSIHTRAYYHSIGTQKTAKVVVGNARTDFNVYAIEWSPAEIRWFVNGQHYFTFKNERSTVATADYKQWPFDKPFHLILNVAVGGTWGGSKGVDESIWPQQMVVDYVRVYKVDKSD